MESKTEIELQQRSISGTSLTKTYSATELSKVIDDSLPPAKQLEFLNNPARVYAVDCPTLGQIYKVLGEKKSIAIVGKQLVEILIASDITNTSKRAVAKTSLMIIAKYSFLKLSELMLFVARFNAGEFDKLYNKFDSIAIMRSLSTFMEQREQDISYYTDRDIPKKKRVCPEGFTPYQFYMEVCRAKTNNNQAFIDKYKEYIYG